MTTRSVIYLLGFIICLNIDYALSEDIVLKSGKTYKNIDVCKQEADRLLITYPGGIATIYLKDCLENIQRKYNYNTTAADAAISEREKTAQATQEQLQRDQKTQVENWKKEQAAKDQQKAIDDSKRRNAAEKAENETLVKVQKPMVKCFMSGGSQVIIEYDSNVMKRIDHVSNGTIDSGGGRLSHYLNVEGGWFYYVDDSETINALRLFMQPHYGEKDHAAARYVSCEFLSGLVGPEKSDYSRSTVVEDDNSRRTEEQIRNLEYQQRRISGEQFFMNQYHR